MLTVLLTTLLCQPPVAPPIDPRIELLESRVISIEERLANLEREVMPLESSIRVRTTETPILERKSNLGDSSGVCVDGSCSIPTQSAMRTQTAEVTETMYNIPLRKVRTGLFGGRLRLFRGGGKCANGSCN